MIKNIKFIITIFVVLIIFLILLKGLEKPNNYFPNNTFKKINTKINMEMLYENNKISIDELLKKEKISLINVWASWCLPCRDEHKFLIKLNKNENLEIVGLNYKDRRKNANSFLKEFKNPYNIIVSDDDGTIAIEWGAYGVPESFLIYDNKIIKKIIGPINKDIMAEIKKLIK